MCTITTPATFSLVANGLQMTGSPYIASQDILEFIQLSTLIDDIFSFVTLFILFGFLFLLVNRLLRTYLNFLNYKFIISSKIDVEEMEKAIDAIISASISEFLTLNGLQDQFIGETQEANLRQYVSKTMDEQLSDVFLKKLGFIYNKDAIADILARRILTTISIFVAKNNAAIKK